MRGLANKRHQRQRFKKRAYNFIKYVWHFEPDPKEVQHRMSTRQPCSTCCGNQRKYEGHSRQEKKALEERE